MHPYAAINSMIGMIIGYFVKKGRAAMIVASMNVMPPMVGVPLLTLCDWGPSSLIYCPNFSL